MRKCAMCNEVEEGVLICRGHFCYDCAIDYVEKIRIPAAISGIYANHYAERNLSPEELLKLMKAKYP